MVQFLPVAGAQHVSSARPKAPGPAKVIELAWHGDGIKVINEKQLSVADAGQQYPYEPLEEIQFRQDANGKRFRVADIREYVMGDPDVQNILRRDIRLMAFSAFGSNPRTFGDFTDTMRSSMPTEKFLRDAAIGVLQQAPSGEEAPIVESGFEGEATIENNLYRARVRIPLDWLRFDQLGKIRQTGPELGLAARLTEEATVYNYLFDPVNYTRTNTNNDNDVGANTRSAFEFNTDNLNMAAQTIATAKDPRSGAYLGCTADTIIAGPLMNVDILQLLNSTELRIVGGGTPRTEYGTRNPYQGFVNRVVISPWILGRNWILCDSTKRGFKYLTVEDWDVMQGTMNIDSESYRIYDVIEYLVKGYFGLGFVDDRGWFLAQEN